MIDMLFWNDKLFLSYLPSQELGIWFLFYNSKFKQSFHLFQCLSVSLFFLRSYMYPYMCKVTLHLPPICFKILCITNYISHLKFCLLLKATPSNAIWNLKCASHFLFCYSCSLPISHSWNTNCKFIMQIQRLVFFS
jgi:hypothetical protein